LQEQADEILKSTYNLEILGLKHPLKERELERRLRDFNKPIDVAEYMLQFPENENKDMINR